MIIDRQLLMSDKQAVTQTAPSIDIIDFGVKGNAEAKPLELIIQVNETVTADGAATVTFALETDSAEGFGTATTLWTSTAIGKAALTAGVVVASGKLPRGTKRFLRINYTVGTGPLTKGKFSAFLTNGVQNNSFM